MKMIAGISLAVGLALGATGARAKEMASLDGAKIEALTGLQGTLDPKSGVFKVAKARTDVKISVEGRTLPPFMGLGAWAAFAPMGRGKAMVMGDNVLFEDEVNPVIDAAQSAGLAVTALHNHFFYDDPKVYFLHISGQGDVEALAKGVHAVFAAVQGVRASHAQPAKAFGGEGLSAQSAIAAAPLEQALGIKGQSQDGMFKAVFGRETSMDGKQVGSAMGVNTWAAFAGSDPQAVVDGDFAMAEGKMQGVIRALRAGGINIVAIHSHMAGESPRILFLHYWGKGKALDLAKTLKSALDSEGKAKGNADGMHG